MLIAWVVACSSDSPSNGDESTRDSAGDVVEGGDVGVFALQVGDCVDASAFLETVTGGDPTEVEAFAALPCTETHSGEVVLVDDQFYVDVDEFPASSDELYAAATDPCTAALDEYTGTTYESSPYDFAPLIPTKESWDLIDDRGLICVGVTLNEAGDATVESTESMRG
jgi:Septum formation